MTYNICILARSRNMINLPSWYMHWRKISTGTMRKFRFMSNFYYKILILLLVMTKLWRHLNGAIIKRCKYNNSNNDSIVLFSSFPICVLLIILCIDSHKHEFSLSLSFNPFFYVCPCMSLFPFIAPTTMIPIRHWIYYLDHYTLRVVRFFLIRLRQGRRARLWACINDHGR